MKAIDTVVVGAGQAGLAVSYHLTRQNREHVVLDRGRVAGSWQTTRWDSVRLLTPNWMTRLPGWSYRGPDPEGFMTAAEVARYLREYAASFRAPVSEHTPVTTVSRMTQGYWVETPDRGWHARHVVMATGPSLTVPSLSEHIDPELNQLHAAEYRNPGQLPEGGVLVVGASASGTQIAAELCEAGRDVVVAVGSHTRLPRQYRGMDIMWWLEQSGILAKTIDQVADRRAARSQPSLQLRGGASGADLNLTTLLTLGARLAGRLLSADGARVRFADDLPATAAAADRRLGRTLDALDHYAASVGLEGELLPATPLRPAHVGPGLPEMNMRAEGIRTVIWATGFQHRYPWLQVPVVDRDGNVVQRRGITPARGLYVIGERFLHRRDSSFIDGVRHDARTITDHITASERRGRHGRTAGGQAREGIALR